MLEAKSVPISVFKATCLALLKEVKETGRPLIVTKRGEVVAQVLPPPPVQGRESWLGCMAGSGRIEGDILAPASDPDDWEALRD